MPSKLNPYLTFDGDAKAAMEFYEEVFGGTLRVHTYAEFGDEVPPGHADKIMHAMLETTAGFALMAGDNPPGNEFKPGNTMSISVSGEDETELRRYWERLSGGGTVAVPLEKQMWGDVFGMCVDRFGVTWMVNINAQQG
ncbi:VOC family protein [Streptomyces sp. NPDC048604]|uniref:VOC family protein n=1 Tax=Streptomyces sp. NPDC048604 TaxID=3365578 RepID=UPI0037236974